MKIVVSATKTDWVCIKWDWRRGAADESSVILKLSTFNDVFIQACHQITDFVCDWERGREKKLEMYWICFERENVWPSIRKLAIKMKTKSNGLPNSGIFRMFSYRSHFFQDCFSFWGFFSAALREMTGFAAYLTMYFRIWQCIFANRRRLKGTPASQPTITKINRARCVVTSRRRFRCCRRRRRRLHSSAYWVRFIVGSPNNMRVVNTANDTRSLARENENNRFLSLSSWLEWRFSFCCCLWRR